jgi:hypothetical protein
MIALLRRRFGQQWQELAASQPGKRFQERYHCQREHGGSPVMQIDSVVAGIVLFIAGMIMLFVPGPGILAMLVGAALLAEGPLVAARTLDWQELNLRRMVEWEVDMKVRDPATSKSLGDAVRCLLTATRQCRADSTSDCFQTRDRSA